MQTDPDHAPDTTPPPTDEESTQGPADEGQVAEEEPRQAEDSGEAPGRPASGSHEG